MVVQGKVTCLGPPVLVLLSRGSGLGSEMSTLDRTGKQMASALFSSRSSNTALVSSNEQMESWHLKPGWPWITCPSPSLYRGETGAQVTRMRETPWTGKTNGSSPWSGKEVRGRSPGLSGKHKPSRAGSSSCRQPGGGAAASVQVHRPGRAFCTSPQGTGLRPSWLGGVKGGEVSIRCR